LIVEQYRLQALLQQLRRLRDIRRDPPRLMAGARAHGRFGLWKRER
jgi:hypothetical protein